MVTKMTAHAWIASNSPATATARWIGTAESKSFCPISLMIRAISSRSWISRSASSLFGSTIESGSTKNDAPEPERSCRMPWTSLRRSARTGMQ